MGLARQATRLPLTALSIGIEAWERGAGVRRFARRRAGEALQIAGHTPLGRLLPTPRPARVTAAEPAPVAEAEPVRAEVEQLVDRLAIPEPESRDELPIPDFDNITLGALRARLRNLTLEQLVTLREWEQAHAHRLPVLTTLDNRIAKLGPTEAYPDGQEAPARLQ